MSDLFAAISLILMFIVAILYVRGCDGLKGAR
jgi:hypothetical protein